MSMACASTKLPLVNGIDTHCSQIPVKDDYLGHTFFPSQGESLNERLKGKNSRWNELREFAVPFGLP